ncbi:DUF4437 domain-containing protein [Gilvimarinus algae]|uniref:DUF4437 domain-containing protein n=1 Tax=Gilvimarinus algae TaxID=3058037 RepID=A0ABT8TCQ1_9GAMM|nr:DUF4437 domain-containing protein [Gilvimarinus sp. SDUM040014]MDO3380908.1 DUF4437 domain-containing protein [Gilvimarinus sp. SDUM040014]
MSNRKSSFSLIVDAILSSLCATPLVLFSLSAAANGITSTPVDQLGYDVTPEGVAFAPLKGNRFEEPYMAMVRLPAGLVSPPHTKTAAMYGVIVQGEMTHSLLGTSAADEIALPAGSFYIIPADIPHVSKCISDIDCVTFLYQDGKFDFNLVQQ